jgi:uncharacterized protein (DUF983 family)
MGLANSELTGASQILTGILNNCCPECRIGKVFVGIYKMNARCTQCGLVYEKEPGYFLGALVFAYLIGVFSVVPTIVIGIFFAGLKIPDVIALGIVQVLVLHPFLFRYSKLTWLFVETRMTRSLDP